jgi:hypothetical protein
LAIVSFALLCTTGLMPARAADSAARPSSHSVPRGDSSDIATATAARASHSSGFVSSAEIIARLTNRANTDNATTETNFDQLPAQSSR